MKRTLLFTALFVGASLCTLPMQAQSPGGAPSQSSPQSPGSPGSMQTPSTLPAGSAGDATQGGVPQTKVDDSKFVKEAAIGGLTEVELGKLAQQKASSDAVKQFGQKMVDDHSKANDELKQIASKENITVPDQLDSKHQARIDKLSKLSGAQFDKAYIKDQLKDHKQDVREFEAESQLGSRPGVKEFASKTLPTLKEHLSSVEDLNKQTKGQ